MNERPDLLPVTTRPFPLFLVLLVTFGAGVYLDRQGWLPGNSGQAPPGVRKSFAPFWEAWHKVREHYVDREKLDDRKMTAGAINGMLDSLGDRGHTAYLTKEERERASEELGGQMQGIGARVSLRMRKPTIIQVMPKSPARQAGLQVGDVLLAVDGEEVGLQSLTWTVNRVRGPAGTQVQLRVQRIGEDKPREVSVTRAKVEIPEVSWQLLPGSPKVAHLALQRFSKESGKQMQLALEQLLAEKVEGVILDLRGNVGGFKDQCVEIAGQFLPEGTVLFIQEDGHKNQEKIRAPGGGKATDLPLVVLIDGGTASSSEILAGALQDQGRAQLIGTGTYGTGTVLREYILSDGSSVRLAVYKWLTPLGREIWHKGIQPDPGLAIKMAEDDVVAFPDPEHPWTEATWQRCTDRQLRKGLEVVRQRLAASLRDKAPVTR
jgi:carboxyl-terminal processing protease